MAGCTLNWTWNNDRLLLNGSNPSPADIQSSLRVYESNGCQCGKGLDCPIMLYLLHDNDEDDDFVEDDFASDSNDMFDSTPEEDNFIIRQREEVTSFEQEDVDDSGRFDIPPFGENTISPFDDYNEEDDLTEDWSEDNFEIDEQSSPEPSRFEFAQDDRLFVPTSNTDIAENDIVEDVFDSMPARNYGEPPIRESGDSNRVTEMVDHYERKQSEVLNISERTARLSRENKLLKEKLAELEGQVNQQLREISIRQKETGQFEDEMQNTKGENMQLVKGMLMCLKLLKFLPDKHKMNFKNSNDYRQMMDIYKKYVEPKKGDVK